MRFRRTASDDAAANRSAGSTSAGQARRGHLDIVARIGDIQLNVA
ncbi:MAG: hypothetical protein SYR96_29315 [Actinomycetota bacterium]|nr:hypothetical protein [Actinomycetota bacterium]